jgi:7-cyano-7-deazaguanine synthase
MVAIATNAGDHAIYPDCRPAFLDAARAALCLGTDAAVGLGARLVHTPKAEIDVPFAET